MRRSGPPERRTPLGRGDSSLSRSPMHRGKALERRERVVAEARSGVVPQQRKVKEKPERGSADREPAKKPLPRNTGPNRAVRKLVTARDRTRCVRCGAPATNIHHREGRGAGGRGADDSARINGPAMLLSLCGMGNTSGCHRWVDTERGDAEAMGYVIRRNGVQVDAEEVPVLTADGWQLFTEDGRRVPLDWEA